MTLGFKNKIDLVIEFVNGNTHLHMKHATIGVTNLMSSLADEFEDVDEATSAINSCRDSCLKYVREAESDDPFGYAREYGSEHRTDVLKELEALQEFLRYIRPSGRCGAKRDAD